MSANRSCTEGAETPLTDKLIDDMLHGDGIPRCREWERLEAHAREMERTRQFDATRRMARLLRECVTGVVGDCTDWNRRTREVLKEYDAERFAALMRPNSAEVGRKVKPHRSGQEVLPPFDLPLPNGKDAA